MKSQWMNKIFIFQVTQVTQFTIVARPSIPRLRPSKDYIAKLKRAVHKAFQATIKQPYQKIAESLVQSPSDKFLSKNKPPIAPAVPIAPIAPTEKFCRNNFLKD